MKILRKMVKFGLVHNDDILDIREDTEEDVPPSKNSPYPPTALKDNLTEQQRSRDRDTTALYKQFVEAHKEKQRFSKKAKKAICVSCVAWVSLLIIVCCVLSIYVITKTNRQSSDIVALISAVIPIVVAIVGTLNIVVRHVFPENEEKNITEIVKAIHENDFKNKQENLKRPN